MSAEMADLPDYTTFTPDIEYFISPYCRYLNVDALSPLICGISLSVLMQNVRSCKRNFDNFVAHFQQCFAALSCIILVETWLTDSRDNIYDINGFHCYNLYRNQYGGGIKLYLKNCIQSKVLETYTILHDLLEMLTVELLFGNQRLLLIAVYHPPTSSLRKNLEFVDLFASYLYELEKNKQTRIANDYCW